MNLCLVDLMKRHLNGNKGVIKLPTVSSYCGPRGGQRRVESKKRHNARVISHNISRLFRKWRLLLMGVDAAPREWDEKRKSQLLNNMACRIAQRGPSHATSERSNAARRKRVRAFDYVFIYLSTLENFWRASTMRALGPTMKHPFKREDEAGYTHSLRCLLYILTRREEKKERKEIWSNFFPEQGCPLKSYTRNQFSGTTMQYTSSL